MNHLISNNVQLDDVDRTILESLTSQGRTTTAELSRRVGMSAPGVAERIRRLEDSGVITGYRAEISAEALGRPITAMLRVRPVPGKMQQVTEILASLPEITRCDRITGEDCFLARASLRSIADMERLIDRLVRYAMTNTSIVQSTPVAERLPPLE